VHADGGIRWSRFPVFIPRAFSTRSIRRYIREITVERYITRVSLVYRLHRVRAPPYHCLSITQFPLRPTTATSSERLKRPESYFRISTWWRKDDYSLRRVSSLASARRSLERDTSGLTPVCSQKRDRSVVGFRMSSYAETSWDAETPCVQKHLLCGALSTSLNSISGSTRLSFRILRRRRTVGEVARIPDLLHSTMTPHAIKRPASSVRRLQPFPRFPTCSCIEFTYLDLRFSIRDLIMDPFDR